MRFYKRPPGRPPTRLLSKAIYWTYVLIGSILLNLWITLGLIGGMISYKLVGTPESIFLGILIGISLGYTLGED